MGIDHLSISSTTGALVTDRTPITQVTLLHVSAGVESPSAPIHVEVSISAPGGAAVVVEGWVSSTGSNVFRKIRWDGELPIPERSQIVLKARNDTGATEVVDMDWVWRQRRRRR